MLPQNGSFQPLSVLLPLPYHFFEPAYFLFLTVRIAKPVALPFHDAWPATVACNTRLA